MQASRLTAIAVWLRSGETRPCAGNWLTPIPILSAQLQNFDCGSCAVSRSGWSASRRSNTILREALARSDAVFTFMPAAGMRMQLAANTRSPSISTMQARQLPRLHGRDRGRSEEHTSELQSPDHLVCRLLLEKKKK